MVRYLLISFVLLTLVGTVAANDFVELQKQCKNRKLTDEVREVACSKVLEDESLSDRERANFLYRLGDLRSDLRRYQEAIVTFGQALVLDPTMARVYRGRAYAYGQLKNYREAIEDIGFVLTIEPDYAWSHFYKGYCHYKLNESEQALLSFAKSLQIKPTFASTFYYRGKLYQQMGELAKSAADFYSYLEIKPFESDVWRSLGKIEQELNRSFQAFQCYAKSRLMHPGHHEISNLINSVMAPPVAIELPEFTFVSPQKNLTIKYMQIVKDKFLDDDVDDILGGLFRWFVSEPKQIKKFSTIAQSIIGQTGAGITEIALQQLYPESNSAVSRVFQSILPIEIGFGKGPKIRFAYQLDDLRKIYPLVEGKKSQGETDIELLCPPFQNPSTDAMGCLPGNYIKVGTMNWHLSVGKPEQVLVSAGKFDTHVVNFYESSSISLLGRTEQRKVSTTYWIAPKINWWVKRTRQQDGMGGQKGKIAISEATEIINQP